MTSVTGSITTNFVDETAADLGAQFIEKSYLIDIYPNLNPSLITPLLYGVGGNTGSNTIGDNTVIFRSSPVQTASYGANWKQADTSKYGTNLFGIGCAVKNDGTLWVWGQNPSGQLGDNTIVAKSSPVQTVTFATNWQQVAAGGQSNAAIKNDGTLWCWGRNDVGQLGDNTTTNKSSPVQTITFGTNWRQVACGYYHTAAIKTDGTLWLWGNNVGGQLGDNTTVNKSSPVQTAAFGTNWKQVACNYQHTAAIKNDGTLWMWGNNTNGRLGDNTTVNKSSPVQTVTFAKNWQQVSAGYSFTAAIQTDGTLWTWGLNTSGQSADNTIVSKSSPIQTITYANNWKQVATGYNHVAALKTDGTVWCWGQNLGGQVGDNTTVNKSSPVQTVTAGNTWKSVAAGTNFSFMIKDANF